MSERWWNGWADVEFERRLDEVAAERGVSQSELLDRLADRALAAGPGASSLLGRAVGWLRNHVVDIAFGAALAVGLLVVVVAVSAGGEGSEAVVAARPIEEGRLLSAADVRTVMRRGASAPVDMAEVVDRVALRAFEQGAVVTQEGLSARAPAGSAIVSVPLDPEGLKVQGGDRVDLFVVGSGSAEALEVSGVLVLAAGEGSAIVAMEPRDLKGVAPLLVKGSVIPFIKRGVEEEGESGRS